MSKRYILTYQNHNDGTESILSSALSRENILKLMKKLIISKNLLSQYVYRLWIVDDEVNNGKREIISL